MKRRTFFKLIAGAVLSPVASKVAIALPSVPVLYGDGEHDDTDALHALLNGEVVEFAYPEMAEKFSWIDGVPKLPQGIFRIDAPIMYPDNIAHILGGGVRETTIADDTPS
jgi:hypothetical protein